MEETLSSTMSPVIIGIRIYKDDDISSSSSLSIKATDIIITSTTTTTTTKTKTTRTTATTTTSTVLFHPDFFSVADVKEQLHDYDDENNNNNKIDMKATIIIDSNVLSSLSSPSIRRRIMKRRRCWNETSIILVFLLHCCCFTTMMVSSTATAAATTTSTTRRATETIQAEKTKRRRKRKLDIGSVHKHEKQRQHSALYLHDDKSVVREGYPSSSYQKHAILNQYHNYPSYYQPNLHYRTNNKNNNNDNNNNNDGISLITTDTTSENSNDKNNDTKNKRRRAITVTTKTMNGTVQRNTKTTIKNTRKRRISDSSNSNNNSYEKTSTNSYNSNDSSNNTSLMNNNLHGKGMLRIQPFCLHNYIQITSLQLLCDTPGAYYHGSNAYRHSEVCQTGDKAYIEMDFIVPNRMKDKTVYMQIEFGLYDHFQVVNMTVLCSLPITLVKAFPEKVYSTTITTAKNSSTDDDNDDDSYNNYNDDNSYNWLRSCTNASGRYHMSTYYTVPKINDWDNFHYTPDVRLTFFDEQARKVGCTVTGPYSIYMDNNLHAENAWIALACACGLFVFIFGLLLHISNQRKVQQIEQIKNRSSKDQQNINNKLVQLRHTTDPAILAQQRRLMYGIDHHQYYRTLPNGQVVSIPGLQPLHHHQFYRSPLPVLSVTRRQPITPSFIPPHHLEHNPSQQQQQQHPLTTTTMTPSLQKLPTYLQNMPSDSSSDDDDDDSVMEHNTNNALTSDNNNNDISMISNNINSSNNTADMEQSNQAAAVASSINETSIVTTTRPVI